MLGAADISPGLSGNHSDETPTFSHSYIYIIKSSPMINALRENSLNIHGIKQQFLGLIATILHLTEFLTLNFIVHTSKRKHVTNNKFFKNRMALNCI